MDEKFQPLKILDTEQPTQDDGSKGFVRNWCHGYTCKCGRKIRFEIHDQPEEADVQK